MISFSSAEFEPVYFERFLPQMSGSNFKKGR
jgi:hypothetical protein